MVAALAHRRALHAAQRGGHRRCRHRLRSHPRPRRRSQRTGAGGSLHLRRQRAPHGACRPQGLFGQEPHPDSHLRTDARAIPRIPGAKSLGGCRIGSRPVDFHIRALQDLGATLHDEAGNAQLTCDGLYGNKIHLEYPSVGATEQVILAAVLAARQDGAFQRGYRARDHGPDHGAAKDGRHHQRGRRPGDHHRRRPGAARLRSCGRSGPAGSRLVGQRRRRHRRTHLRAQRPPVRHDDVPQPVPPNRRRLPRSDDDGIDVLARAISACARPSSRPMSIPAS